MKKSRPPQKLGTILDNVLSQKGYLSACREAEVVHKWPQLVGDRIASVTSCTESTNGVLYVRVQSSPWRQELSFLKQRILAELKQKTKCASIRDIVFY